MSELSRFGDGNDCYRINDPNDGTDPLESGPFGIQRQNIVSAQLLTEAVADRTFLSVDTDNVVSGTKTWNVASGAFTADDVGATFTVDGSVSNDGTYTVASVTDSNTIVSVEAPVGDETFPDNVVFVMSDLNTVDGAWLVEVSNDFTPASNGSNYGQNPEQGHWTVIPNDQWAPAIADVDHTDSDTTNQFVQAELAARAVRFTFTPESGLGQVLCIVYAKSQG